MANELNDRINSITLEISQLQAEKFKYFQQYEASEDATKQYFLQLIVSVQNQLASVQNQLLEVERQKTLLLKHSTYTTAAELERPLTPMEVVNERSILNIMNQWGKHVFRITGDELSGTCVLISERYVLTAAHLSFELHKSYKITASDGHKFDVKCSFICQKMDFALLHSEELPSIQVFFGSIRKGDKYYVMGFPQGMSKLEPAVTKGLVEGTMDDYVHLLGTPGSKRGYSGSPIFNTYGSLVGLLLGGTNGLNVNTSIQELLLSSSEQKYTRILPMNLIRFIYTEQMSASEC